MLILKLSFLWVLLILYRRQNLTPISNIREAAPRSLFWDPNGLNKFLEVCFEFPFILIVKSTIWMAFSTGQSWHVLKSWYTGGGPEQGFQCRFVAVDITYQGLVLSVVQARFCCVLGTRPNVGLTSSVKQTLYEVRVEHKGKKGKESWEWRRFFIFSPSSNTGLLIFFSKYPTDKNYMSYLCLHGSFGVDVIKILSFHQF